MGISRQQALDCFRSDDLVGIGMEADAVRRRLHPEGVVSYAIGCEIECAAGGGAFEAIRGAIEAGATGVLVAGEIDSERIEGILRAIRQRFPTPKIWIEGLSAAEVRTVAAGWSLGLRETIARLMDAGLDSIVGDGTGLDDAMVQEWLEVHRAAHGLGMRTIARMTIGAGETLEQRVDFLEAVRSLQQETGGFAAFAPVAAEAPGGRELDGVTAVERLKTLAIARMFLDNVENVQASAAGEGLKVLQMGLRFGANDAGLFSPQGKGSEEDVRRIIRDAGFKPAQRDVAYRAMMLS